MNNTDDIDPDLILDSDEKINKHIQELDDLESGKRPGPNLKPHIDIEEMILKLWRDGCLEETEYNDFNKYKESKSYKEIETIISQSASQSKPCKCEELKADKENMRGQFNIQRRVLLKLQSQLEEAKAENKKLIETCHDLNNEINLNDK